MKHSIQKYSLSLLLAIAGAVTPAIAHSASAGRASQSGRTAKTLTGVVSDAMCGATHMAKKQDRC